MPSILNLKFKGNKSFVAFSNLNDTESLTKTWKVCTKVASYLEQGQRLENLAWRLWHLQNLMVDTDNAKTKREFKKLSKCMGDKLDKEKGRSIEELPAPAFQRNSSTELIRQRAAEKERSREANAHMPEHIIQRMQFTFPIEPAAPTPSTATTATTSIMKTTTTPTTTPTTTTKPTADAASPTNKRKHGTVRLPTLFSNSFGPTALLAPALSLAPRMNYGDAHSPHAVLVGGDGGGGDMRILRPTIELPLDELLNADGDEGEDDSAGEHSSGGDGAAHFEDARGTRAAAPVVDEDESSDDGGDDSADSDFFEQSMSRARRPRNARPRHSATARRATANATATPAPIASGTGSGGAARRPVLSVRVPASASVRLPAVQQQQPTASSNSAPGGVKAECSNCGATHTPLWRRGLNDELNCNACGLYCKLHKRPRPKTMRNSGTGGEGRGQSVRSETVDVMAQCYNCHTTATPLWRKDDEGKTVCNACGLYYKLHGSARPISMKSDVIRKRSRHDARRGGASVSVSETPTASPGVSRRASPAPGAPGSSPSAGSTSPILAPDSTTNSMAFDATASELSSALGPSQKPGFGNRYPYHEAYPDALPFASVDVRSELDARANKRRRMSVDSASEPPSSATSYSSYADSYNAVSTPASSHVSGDFPFSRFTAIGGGAALRGGTGGSAFWHPPMLPQDGHPAIASPSSFLHPPMLPEEAPADYTHSPVAMHHNYRAEDDGGYFNSNGFIQTGGLHPPMLPSDDSHLMGMGMMSAHPPMMYEDVYDANGNMHY
ncbi:hypothetical protein GGX14DRAFT_350375 [Mycena pura]|uniref:GATA-type domain-containing protein n=1 Tax=Mycena pura TaxID=153505 RepID=A0AAD6YNX5_9AGAR|nr:hypothetical protein GGX14DRAFT_350375 [Mycena pura]